MKNASWKDIAELIGITAIVLSLLFVGLQLRQGQQLAVEEMVNNSNDRQNSVRELILMSPDTWQRACRGEPLDPASRVVAGKIFDAWSDHVIGEYILRGIGTRQSASSQEKIVEEFAAQLWIYPGLKELMAARDKWDNGAVRPGNEFSRRLMNDIWSRLEVLESGDVEPEMDIAWCART